MNKLFIYILYNVIALVLILFVLLYLNTFINGIMINESASKNFALSMIIRFFIVIVEGILLLLIVNQINKRYLMQMNFIDTSAITFIIETAIIIVTCAIVCYQIYQYDK